MVSGHIAVVISTYNHPDYLNLVLQGYERQTDQGFKVYIADDGSSENTKMLINTFRMRGKLNIHHVWHKDQGFRKARIHNEAFRQLTETYMILTDGDCIPLPDMVATHRQYAENRTMINGSRILLSQEWTKELLQHKTLPKITPLNAIFLKFQKKINRILPLWMPKHTSAASQTLSGIHGCHLSLFKKDLMKVNGFDESFEGWGREDSDLVARLFHSGIQRKNLRGTPVLHIWHEDNSRQQLEENDGLLQQCLDEKRQRAVRGIAELSNG